MLRILSDKQSKRDVWQTGIQFFMPAGSAFRTRRLITGGGLARMVGSQGPDFGGTFVVSHGYHVNSPGRTRGCPQDGKSHPAQSGESNLARTRQQPAAPGVESLHTDGEGPLLRCFDTSPFREQQVFDRSPYVRIFESRGEYAMGCKHAMAEDASHATDTLTHDRFTAKVNCE